MSVLLKNIGIDKFSFINDRRDIRLLLGNYDFAYLKSKIDDYINNIVHVSTFRKVPSILVAKTDYGYVALERALDIAIAKVIAQPHLIENNSELYDYIIKKIEPYIKQNNRFFDLLETKISEHNLKLRYLSIEDIEPLPEEEIRSIVPRPDFFSLLKRCYTHCYQNPLKVDYDMNKKKYVCSQNKHYLLAYQLISKLIKCPENTPNSILYELNRYSFDQFFKKIRVDDYYAHAFKIAKVPLKDVHLSSEEDIVYGLINKDPVLFKQLLENIVTNGLKPVEINCIKRDDSFYSLSVGIYPVLGIKLLSNYEVIEKVYPELLEDIARLSSTNKQDFSKLNFSYDSFVAKESLHEEEKVVGILSLPNVVIDAVELQATVRADVNSNIEASEDNPSVPTIEEEIANEKEEELDDESFKFKRKSVTQTIELNMYSDDPYLDERLNAPIKYGLTSLSLNEIEAIDYRDLLANGLSPRYKKEIIDYMTLKKEFPVLHASPSEEGLYKISSIDQYNLLARMIALCPKLIKDMDIKFYDNLMSIKQFYDVKRVLKAEVKVADNGTKKKGNIFHHLTDGKLNRTLLKKKLEDLTFEELVEVSVIKDKDILERFNPVKDPAIFYRTVRSFLECLFHLYYIHLDSENIFHDNGKWTDKFKPLSTWVQMFKAINKRSDIRLKVFTDSVWESFVESMKMVVVFMLNEITHMSFAAERYKNECADFIWKNASLESVIIYILNNIR